MAAITTKSGVDALTEKYVSRASILKEGDPVYSYTYPICFSHQEEKIIHL